ncbi:MAG: DMT family transporter [Phycisphaeraceae bacterium]|nr:DMT family transporter [Phycisphaeraceae bacterium]
MFTGEGELAGLLAAGCWTISTLAFASAGRRVGSIAVNIIRMVMALLLMTAACMVLDGRLVALELSGHFWLWMSLSGVVGFFLGDLALFRAFVLIGPRLSSLLMALAPPFAALTAWFWLDERLSGLSMLGMALTLGGVAWVILETRTPEERARSLEHVSPWGVTLGIGGALGQGIGLVMAKVAMAGSAEEAAVGIAGEPIEQVSALVSTQVRAASATACFLLLLLMAGQRRKVIAACRHPSGLGLITLGAVVGPFLGVALLLRSAQLVPAGIAQTLAATVPVLILPCLVLLYRQKVSARSVTGACIAVAGVAVLLHGG